MEDQARRQVPPEPGHSQGIHHQLPPHALAHCKADHLPIEQVDDYGKIEPALFGPDIGYVPCSDLVRRIHGEVACQQVRRDRQIMGTVRGCLEPALAASTQAAGLHHPAHTLLARSNATRGKFTPYPRTAIPTYTGARWRNCSLRVCMVMTKGPSICSGAPNAFSKAGKTLIHKRSSLSNFTLDLSLIKF